MASSSRFATISEAQLDELVRTCKISRPKIQKEQLCQRAEFLKSICKKMTKRNRKPKQKSAMYYSRLQFAFEKSLRMFVCM